MEHSNACSAGKHETGFAVDVFEVFEESEFAGHFGLEDDIETKENSLVVLVNQMFGAGKRVVVQFLVGDSREIADHQDSQQVGTLLYFVSLDEFPQVRDHQLDVLTVVEMTVLVLLPAKGQVLSVEFSGQLFPLFIVLGLSDFLFELFDSFVGEPLVDEMVQEGNRTSQE